MPTIQETLQKTRDFIALPRGWHFGNGVPTPLERITQAASFLRFAELKGIRRANAFPGVRGQLEVTFYDADRILEITIEVDNSFTIAEAQGREQISFEEDCSRADVYRKIDEFGQNRNIWPSFDLFTANTTTQNAGVLPPRRWTLEEENRFRLLIVNVQEPTVARFVRISHGTTTNKLGTQQFTGQYPTQSFQLDAESRQKEPIVEMNATATSTIGAAVVLPAPFGK